MAGVCYERNLSLYNRPKTPAIQGRFCYEHHTQQEVAIITSFPKVIWEEGRVAALSHTYAVKSPLVTMARLKFAPKSTPSRGPIPNPTTCLIPGPVRPTMQTASGSNPPFFHNALDRPTHRPTDRPRESLITIGRCAPTAYRMFSLLPGV